MLAPCLFAVHQLSHSYAALAETSLATGSMRSYYQEFDPIVCRVPALWITADVFVLCPDASVAPILSPISPGPVSLMNHHNDANFNLHLF